MIDFKKHSFHPVIFLPDKYEVLDFSKKNPSSTSQFSIGKYNEKRPFLYTSESYTKTKRNIHMGLDIGAPEKTSVHIPLDGEIFDFKDHGQKQNYGPTIITKHCLDQVHFYLLFGHLSKKSLQNKNKGDLLKKGEKFAELGDREENGYWPTHLHFQISYLEPKDTDLLGVVSEKEHPQALKNFPDPRLILGDLY